MCNIVENLQKFEELEKQNLAIMHFNKSEMNKMSIKDIFKLLDFCLTLFRKNYELNNFDMIIKISDKCEELFSMLHFSDYKNNYKYIEIALEIACLVYEQTYKYTLKTQILKEIIESEESPKDIKIRALENILEPEPESVSLIKEQINYYTELLKTLQLEEGL